MFNFYDIPPITLSSGSHSVAESALNVMEAVAFFVGEPRSCWPETACPLLAAYALRLNDGMDDEARNRLLRPRIVSLVDTRGNAAAFAQRAEFLCRWGSGGVRAAHVEAYKSRWAALKCQRVTQAAADDLRGRLFERACAGADAIVQRALEAENWQPALEGLDWAIRIGPSPYFNPYTTARELKL